MQEAGWEPWSSGYERRVLFEFESRHIKYFIFENLLKKKENKQKERVRLGHLKSYVGGWKT